MAPVLRKIMRPFFVPFPKISFQKMSDITMDEGRVRTIVADLLEDVVVAKPEDPVGWLLETLQSSAKPLGDAELTRRLNNVLKANDSVVAIAKNFPQHRRQIKNALEKTNGTIGEFMITAKEALAGPAGPTSI